MCPEAPGWQADVVRGTAGVPTLTTCPSTLSSSRLSSCAFTARTAAGRLMSRSAGASSSSPSAALPRARAACAGEPARQERMSARTVVLLREHSACSIHQVT